MGVRGTARRGRGGLSAGNILPPGEKRDRPRGDLASTGTLRRSYASSARPPSGRRGSAPVQSPVPEEPQFFVEFRTYPFPPPKYPLTYPIGSPPPDKRAYEQGVLPSATLAPAAAVLSERPLELSNPKALRHSLINRWEGSPTPSPVHSGNNARASVSPRLGVNGDYEAKMPCNESFTREVVVRQDTPAPCIESEARRGHSHEACRERRPGNLRKRQRPPSSSSTDHFAGVTTTNNVSAGGDHAEISSSMPTGRDGRDAPGVEAVLLEKPFGQPATEMPRAESVQRPAKIARVGSTKSMADAGVLRANTTNNVGSLAAPSSSRSSALRSTRSAPTHSGRRFPKLLVTGEDGKPAANASISPTLFQRQRLHSRGQWKTMQAAQAAVNATVPDSVPQQELRVARARLEKLRSERIHLEIVEMEEIELAAAPLVHTRMSSQERNELKQSIERLGTKGVRDIVRVVTRKTTGFQMSAHIEVKLELDIMSSALLRELEVVVLREEGRRHIVASAKLEEVRSNIRRTVRTIKSIKSKLAAVAAVRGV